MNNIVSKENLTNSTCINEKLTKKSSKTSDNCNEDFEFVKFEDLSTSTSTIMVYTNLMFNQSQLFRYIPIYPISDPPLTKKKKKVNKKLLHSPYGTIIGTQLGIYYRGIRTSVEKKYWCPICQLLSEQDKKILSVVEEERSISFDEAEELQYPLDAIKIHFKCTSCERYLDTTLLRKIVPFLNQLTVVISTGNVMVNAMIFKDSFKLAGNKDFNTAIEAVMLLWEEYIHPIQKSWTYRKFDGGPKCNEDIVVSYERDPTTFMENPKGDAHFLFDVAMRNVDFHLDFPIDKKKLNVLMNNPIYGDMVFLSKYESTSVTHVNIKMHSEKPDDLLYEMLIYEKASKSSSHFVSVNEKLYSKQKNKPLKQTTFIVFSSSEIILSGRYNSVMKKAYEFFVQTAYENRDQISEKLEKPKISLMDFMKSRDVDS